MSNMVGAMFGCFPASGSLPRSRVAAAAGAQTPAANFFAAMVVLVAIVALLPAAAALPLSVVSAVVVCAVVGIIDLATLAMLVRLRLWADVTLWVAIFATTIVFGVDVSIFLALGACLLMLVKSVAVVQPSLLVLGQLDAATMRAHVRLLLDRADGAHRAHSPPDPDTTSGSQATASASAAGAAAEPAADTLTMARHVSAVPHSAEYVDVAQWPDAEPVPGLLILKLTGAVNFATIGRIQTLFQRLAQFGSTHVTYHESAPPPPPASVTSDAAPLSSSPALVLDLSSVSSFDGSSIAVFCDILAGLRHRHPKVLLSGLSQTYACAPAHL